MSQRRWYLLRKLCKSRVCREGVCCQTAYVRYLRGHLPFPAVSAAVAGGRAGDSRNSWMRHHQGSSPFLSWWHVIFGEQEHKQAGSGTKASNLWAHCCYITGRYSAVTHHWAELTLSSKQLCTLLQTRALKFGCESREEAAKTCWVVLKLKTKKYSFSGLWSQRSINQILVNTCQSICVCLCVGVCVRDGCVRDVDVLEDEMIM